MPASEKRVVLITGATRGIGAAIATRFAADGAEVIATGTDTATIDRLNATAAPEIRYVQADFTSAEGLRAFCSFVEGLPRLDVCVNNAGINIIKTVDDVTEADFDRLTSIDYRAPYFISQSAARVMRRARRGWIVNIASIWSVITKKGRTQYTAAKTGLVGMTRGMAVDLASDGILVNCVSPGFVLTDLTRQSLTETEQATLAVQVPLGRMAEPAEIARVVAFLASADNTYITGQNLVVDGGFSHV